MTLRELLAELPRAVLSGSADTEITGLTCSSREAAPGLLFAALRGHATDGHRFIPQAIEAGAAAILAETAPPADTPIPWLHVPDSRAALSHAASTLHAHPWREMALAGITGTNGKTTTAFLIHHVMRTAWHRAGLLGTVQIDDGEETSPASHTTPDPVELSALLDRMRSHGCRGLAMEVSSHGIHQQRVAAIGFDACVFTNLTQDHLDYHGTMEAYFQAKADWFLARAADPLGKKPVAVINTDDPYGLRLSEMLDGRMKIIRYGFNVHCDFRALDFRQSPRGMQLQLEARGKSWLVRAPLIGRFNAYNLLAAIAAANACGIRPREAVAALAEAPQVPGRMENVGHAGGATVFVDYAHTPDALENACRTLRELQPRGLITVFGCGGDRDRGKRPLMAAAASRHSEVCILTSDNPRSEDPAAILREMESGMSHPRYTTIPDRAEAIETAISTSRSGDIILIAGKGHETTQQFADRVLDFDDRRHAAASLRRRAAAITEMRNQPPPPRPPRS
jgi:UDP-N-acetylmuramoyl-L-alanyl-D-glutamate--2,6-diaminopimelate ligase